MFGKVWLSFASSFGKKDVAQRIHIVGFDTPFQVKGPYINCGIWRFFLFWILELIIDYFISLFKAIMPQKEMSVLQKLNLWEVDICIGRS